MDKATARDAIRALVAEDPRLNMAELARRVGVSRQRVAQIVEEEGITLPKWGHTPARIREQGMGPRARTGGVQVPIAGTTAGHIAELLAAADLASRGFAVFLPLIRTELCDLVTVHRETGAVERIEVRSGSRRADGRIVWRKADVSRSERRAIVLTGEPVVYDPPFPDDDSAARIRLR